MKLDRATGILLLGIYMLLIGLDAYTSLGNVDSIKSILALAAGLLLVIGK